MSDDRWNFEFVNGEWVQKGHKLSSFYGAGLFYGAGCFETLLAENGRIYKYNDHIKRLLDGLRYLGRNEYSIPDSGEIREIISEIIQKMKPESGRCRIRIQCSLPERGYNHSPNLDDSVNIHITVDELSTSIKKGIKLKTADTRVVPAACKPAHLKLSNMLHYRNAYNEARRAGCDDALMLNIKGHTAETSVANIFWMKDDQIYTPSAECDILPGIMRNSVIDLLKISFSEKVIHDGEFNPSSLLDADIVWLTNSIIEICAVSHLDGKEIGQNSSFLSRLSDELSEYKNEHME